MITRDKIQNHIIHLQEKHDMIDKEIVTEENQYGNHEHIADLKKEKLYLKDEIEKLKTKL